MRVLLDELSALHDAFRAGEPSPLQPLPVQYADYAAWQREWLAGPVLRVTVNGVTSRDFNIPSLDFRKQCNLLEGGNPDFCNALVPKELIEVLQQKADALRADA